MAYEKPQVLAQNSKEGAYSAGCPFRDHASPAACEYCKHGY